MATGSATSTFNGRADAPLKNSVSDEGISCHHGLLFDPFGAQCECYGLSCRRRLNCSGTPRRGYPLLRLAVEIGKVLFDGIAILEMTYETRV